MNSLRKLILKFGKPDALIDHWDNSSKRVAIWGFKEIFLYNCEGSFLNDEKIDGDPLDICNMVLDKWSRLDNSSIHAVGYFSYDLKNYL